MQINLCFIIRWMSLILVFMKVYAVNVFSLSLSVSSICGSGEIVTFFCVDHYLFVIRWLFFFYLFIIFFFLYHQAFAKRVLFTQQYENFILNYNIFSVTVSVHVSNVCQRRRRSQFPKFNSQFSSFFLFISLLAHGPHGKKGGAHQPKCRPFRKTS